MKKIFTLLFSTFVIGSGTLFAQSAIIFKPVAGHAIIVNGNFHRYDEMYSFTRYEHDLKIKKINEDYNNAMKDIIKMRFLSAAQKVKLIRTIELKRAEQIKNVNTRFNDYRNKYNDYYDSNFRWRR
jgi:hypothetical protein